MTDTTNIVASSDVSKPVVPNEPAILQRMILDLTPLSPDVRQRLINTVCMFFDLASSAASGPASGSLRQTAAEKTTSFQFSEDETPTVKQFVHDKGPQTDVERVACLAYYLARYRSTPHVKTKDITALNTESAQRPFSNTALAVDNATKTGYLVPSIKGSKQISAYGERFVEALPDREVAKEIMAAARAGRRGKPAKKPVTGAA